MAQSDFSLLLFESHRTWADLAHEVGDDAVEAGALVAVPLLAGAQRAEVLARPRGHVKAELKGSRCF